MLQIHYFLAFFILLICNPPIYAFSNELQTKTIHIQPSQLEKEKTFLKKQFLKRMKTPLNLENPQTINEKIQWLKLYNRHPIHTLCADKYRVREFVKDRVGENYLIPLLGVYNCADEIDFDKLPNQFALKANHGSAIPARPIFRCE